MSGAFVCSRCNGAMPMPAPGEQKQCPCGVSCIVGALPAPSWSTTPSQGLDAATVERCAQVIEDHGNTWGLAYRSMTDTLANAVRALATEPHQHGGKGA